MKQPDFIIAGVMKCGTSSLMRTLAAHPLLYLPDGEVHFFDRHQDEGLDWYLAHFPDDGRTVGEKTPAYFKMEKLWVTIKETLPDAKIILRSMLAFLRIPRETPFRTKFLKVAPPRRRCVIYTCLFGDYDDLPPAPDMLGPASAVCFTDNLDREPNGWLLRSLPAGGQLDPIRASRFAKILPHRLLPEYDASLYIDCNVRLKRDVSELFDLGHLWVVPKHPHRECIFFEESKKLLEKRKIDDPRQLLDQLRRYRLAGMPEYFGLTENSFIVRQHHHETVKEFGEAWWQEYLNGCPRDQISFPFVAWKTTLPHLKLEPAFCKRAFKRVPHLHWVSPADAQPTRDPAPSPPRRIAFHRSTQLVNLDQLRIAIVTHRDYSKMKGDPSVKNSGSSRLRGDWLVKYWPQAELFEPRTIYDVLIFQKAGWVEWMELFCGITVYDACDPKKNWLTMAQLCDLATTSSQGLARELENALFIPDRFDLDYFTLQKVHEARATEAVWFGYRKNIELLAPFLRPLNKLGIRLKTITDKPTDVGDVNLCFPNNPHDPDYSALNYELIQSDIVLNPPLHKFKSENKTHHAWLLNLPVAKTPEEVETFLEPYSRNVEVDRGALDIRLSVREFKSLLTTFIREHNITGPKLIYSRMRTKVKSAKYYAKNVGRTSVSKVRQRIRREIVYQAGKLWKD